MKRPVITLLTDFGCTDHYAAAMKGVILGICPHAQLVDISHEFRPYAITEAAFTMAQAWRYFPKAHDPSGRGGSGCGAVRGAPSL